jgi:LCP family protein required for cell wall assembly
MIDDMLRETFARHEAEAPRTDDLRRGIDRLTVRRRRRRTAVLTGGTAATVVLVLVAVSVFVRLLAPNLPVAPVIPGIVGTVPDRALNFLVLGIDDAPGMPEPYRSDSITVVHIPRERQAIYLVDFERDVQVEIPGHGTGRINTAHALGGPQLAAAVVQNLTGLTLDGTVVVGLGALGELVDALGPLQMCVPTEITSIHTGQTYAVGCYDVDADAVTDLVRQRTGLPRASYDRNEIVQSVMRMLFARALSLDLLTDADRIAALLGTDGLTIDLPGLDLVGLAGQVRHLTANELLGIVSPYWQPTPDGQGEQLDPVVTPDLFAALRTDTMASFVTAHPDWVATT